MSSDPGSSRDPLRAIYEHEQRRPRRSRFFTAAVTLLVFGAFALVVYYAYQLGLRAGAQGPAPLIKAEQQPYKVKPEEPGGMDVPNQDKLIYKEVKPAGAGPSAQPAERLMPPPESPLPKPAAEEPQPQQAQAAEPPAAQAAAPVASASAATPPSNPVAAPAAAETPAKETAPQQVAQGGGLEAPSTPAKSGSSNQPVAPPAPAAANPPAPAPAATPAAAAKAPAKAVASAEKPAGNAASRDVGDWHIQLGAVRTAEEAQHEWARLQGKYPDLLGQLSLNIQRVDLGGDKGVFFRIRGGELPDRAQANALCDKLKAIKVGCLAVKP